MIRFTLFFISLFCITNCKKDTTTETLFNVKPSQSKNLQNLVKLVMEGVDQQPPIGFIPESNFSQHRPESNAVFAAAIDEHSLRKDAVLFAGTLRQTGYDGDIVIATMSTVHIDFLNALKATNCIVYFVKPECVGQDYDTKCRFPGQSREENFSINMIRYFLYKWWAMKYDSSSRIILSDFRDVTFQINPFTYRREEWHNYQLIVFLENHPTKVIERCPFNSGWIQACYGEKGLIMVGSETASCSGVSLGIRDAILAYVHLMLIQLEPAVRYDYQENPIIPENNHGCTSLGMDQGFHNWLLYSKQLERYMSVKIFSNGDGIVNTIGSYQGSRAPLQWSLEKWTVLRETEDGNFFYNWNGDLSPIIHQYDRYMNIPHFIEDLGVLKPFMTKKKKKK